jgi:hypothetical protein
VNARVIMQRRRYDYRPGLDTCRELTEQALDQLAEYDVGDGIELENGSAHWWVGYLSNQLEAFLAATAEDPS